MNARVPSGNPEHRLDDILPDGFVWMADTGKILSASGQDTGAFGLAHERLPGCLVGDLEPVVGAALQRALTDLRSTGDPQTVEWARREGGVLRAWEGRLFPHEGRVLAVVRDRSQQLRTDRLHAAHRERLAVTLRSIADGVLATDVDGRLTLLNPAAEKLLGVASDAVAGRPMHEVLPADYFDPWGAVRPIVEHTHLDGQPHRVRLSMAPVLQGGRMLGAVYVLRDVTQEWRAEEERLRASKLESVGLLAGGLAHDFNNLLAAIQGNLSVARAIVDDLPDNDELRDIFVDVDAAARRAAALTRQLLTFSTGGAPMLAVANIEEAVRHAVDFGMHGSNVRHDYDIAPDLPAVRVDLGQIAQVLQNLVINACQAMPDGGILQVAVDAPSELPADLGGAEGPWVRIAVRDTGSGIAEGDLARIFDPYFTTKPAGTGLGLASAYSVVRKHDGFIGVQSKLGVGTTFTVYLPALPGVRSAGAQDRDPRQWFEGRMLVVDDEPALRTSAVRLFRALGLEVVAVSDGADGVAAYRQALAAGKRFDVVLLDLTIPGGMGGREAADCLLAIDPDAVCVASSGYSTQCSRGSRTTDSVAGWPSPTTSPMRRSCSPRCGATGQRSYRSFLGRDSFSTACAARTTSGCPSGPMAALRSIASASSDLPVTRSRVPRL